MSTKGGYVENLNFREGNEESSEEARAEKAEFMRNSTTAREPEIS